MSEVPGLRVQLATITARLDRIETEAQAWQDSLLPTQDFIAYLRRKGLLST